MGFFYKFLLGNKYFQFKRFKVMQDKSAMKVCTDSCLFGAWINEPTATEILDIGTGTGLLTLMLAQRHRAVIDAVEIDFNAFNQAKFNVQNSPWSNRIKVHHSDIIKFNPQPLRMYNLIVSNPPFFTNYLKSPDPARNTVLHDEYLSQAKLISCIKRLLDEKGKFYIMLPPEQAQSFEELASEIDLLPYKKLLVRENEYKSTFRVLSAYQYSYSRLETSELMIRNKNQSYSPEFQQLLKDYYLIGN
jgi:tRNA1Val (adenine37-N6)-methyltransferase